jgi:hypothetical protein
VRKVGSQRSIATIHSPRSPTSALRIATTTTPTPDRRIASMDFKGWDPSQGIRFAGPPDDARTLHTTAPAEAASRSFLSDLDTPKYAPLPPLDHRGRIVGAPVEEKAKRKPRAKRVVAPKEDSDEASLAWSDGDSDWVVRGVEKIAGMDDKADAGPKRAATRGASRTPANGVSSRVTASKSTTAQTTVKGTSTRATVKSTTTATRTTTRRVSACTASDGSLPAGGASVETSESTVNTQTASRVRRLSLGSSKSGSASPARTPSPESPKRPARAPARRADGTREDHLDGMPPREALPPVTDLPFVINTEKWQAARDAEPGSAESWFSWRMYEGPPAPPSTDPTQIEVHYCKTLSEMEDVCEKHFVGEEVVGVDLEWQVIVPRNKYDDPRQHVSLIQMSSPTRVALFHVALFSAQAPDGPDGGALAAIPSPDDLVAPTFRAIMEDPAVTKLGVCILGDTARLKKHLAIDAVGLLDLSHLWRVVRYRPYLQFHEKINRVPVRLSLQVEDILGLPMFKETDVRTSDWTRSLSPAQLDCEWGEVFLRGCVCVRPANEYHANVLCVRALPRLGHRRVCLRPALPPARKGAARDGEPTAAAAVCRAQADRPARRH